MRRLSIFGSPIVSQLLTIVLATIAMVIAAASYLFHDSPYSPIIVAGIVATIANLLFWLKKPEMALYAILFVLLLPSGLLPSSIQSILNRVLTIVALGVWVIHVIMKRYRLVLTRSALLMLIFLIWSLMTLIWAQDQSVGRVALGGYTLRFILFLFLIANEINTREKLDGLMRTLAVAGWAFVVIGIGSLLIQGYVIGTRLQVLGGNENTLGVLFPIVFLGVIWKANQTHRLQQVFWALMGFAFIFLSLILIAVSGSRGNAITWIITIVALLFWRQTRIWGFMGIIILTVLAIVAPTIFTTTINRFTIVIVDPQTEVRAALWRAAWLLIRDHPFIGVGIGNAPYQLLPYLRLFIAVPGYEGASIHNPILTIWAETGLPGIVLYMGVLVGAISSFIQQYMRYRKSEINWLMLYMGLITSMFLGYITAWFKGGAMESGHSYFLMIALLLIPSGLNVNKTGNYQGNSIQ